MKVRLLQRFAVTEYEDAFGNLSKLKQTSSVYDYQTRFEKLLARVGTLIDKQEAKCFISRLKDRLRVDVKVQNPQTLTIAIGLARAYEIKA